MKKKVLCVCKMNATRSPMMAALLQRELGDEFEVESAGVCEECAEGYPANNHAVLCMAEKGIDINDHKSRYIDDLDLSLFSHIVCAGEIWLDENALLLAGFKGQVIETNDPVPAPPYENEFLICQMVADRLEKKVIPEITKMIMG